MIVLRILGGALAGVVVATAALLVFIIVSEYALSRGWVGRYDDYTMAVICQVILVSAPVIGAWRAWIGGRDAPPPHS